MLKRFIVITFAALLCAGSAAAQVTPPPDPTNVRMQFGPLWINPAVALTNAGIDTNVFNEADDAGPKRDFTFTLTPRADLWLRVGRTWIAGAVREDMVWYKQYASERSVNNRYSVGWLVPLTRLSFSVGSAWLKTRERPGFEIDVRPRRDEREINGAAEVRVLSKTLFGIRGAQRRVDFADTAVFLGRNLRNELARTTTVAAFTVRHEVTPLTTITFEVADEKDRFEFSSLRDADSRRAEVAVRFDPYALISGTARFGFRDYKPLSIDLSGYRGATTSVDLGFVARGSTRLAVQAVRDIEYSFDVNQPYYLQVGFSGSIAQQIYGPIDVEGRAGTQRLSYRTRAGAVNAPVGRADRVRSYGTGVGYRFGRDFRVGFNVDRQKRTSVVDFREYSGLRYGTTVTYGL